MAKKKTYDVTVPITGYLTCEVEAESEAEAIAAAIENADLSQIESWQAHEHVCKGNVFYGERNNAEAVCADDE